MKVQQKSQDMVKENKVLKIGIRKMNEIIDNFKLGEQNYKVHVQQLQNELQHHKAISENVQQQFQGQVEQTEPYQQLLRDSREKDDFIIQQQAQINFLMSQLNGQPSSLHSQARSGNFFGDSF